MGVKFAGSRAVDDRRRRRLVSENENLPEAPQKASRSGGYWHIRRLDEESYDRPRSPIASLIPFNPVRIWLICCALPVAMLALVLISATWPLPAGHPLRVSLDLQSGHIWRFLTGLMLLACASACWLISWFRAASVNDFEGCFKSWYWSGWAFAIIGIAAGCELHSICSSMVASYTRIEVPLLCALLWLVPVAGIMVEPVRAFTREMWHCRRSWLMLLLCANSAVIYTYAEWMRFQPEYRTFLDVIGTILAATALLTPTLMFSALVSQTHYVMYVSSDPVRKRQSWLFVGMLQGFASLAEGLRSLGDRRRMSITEEDAAEEQSEPEETVALKSRRRKAVAAEDNEVEEKKPARRKRNKPVEPAASESESEDDGQESDGEVRPARRGMMSRLFGARTAAVSEEDDAQPTRAELRRQAREAKKAEKAAKAAARAEEAARKVEEAKAARAAKLAQAEESRKTAIAAKEEAKRSAEAKKEEARLAVEAKREEARLAAEAKKEEARQAAEARKQEEAQRAEEARHAAEQKAAERASRKKPRIRVKSAARVEENDESNAEDSPVQQKPVDKKPVAAKKPVYDDFPQSDDDYDDDDDQQGSIDMENYIGGERLDPNSLKGLSKKERRRLRKLHRDEQRAKAG
ncbi:hypothetical protein [Rubinisphaera margarita]|uniref:hypothetical protein n=1 Tax=Rubinisphaera margarita TaxID=2909586 RepID=UPI001EE80F15|nr:hypothetical protein [Rubinisphaera margarita]MCG6157886.1 hypothetical protein [Rubinisphaera margarita]